MKKNFFSLLFALYLSASHAQTGTASPGWAISIPASTLTEAGNDYASPVASNTNQTSLSFTLSKQGNYEVLIHKIDSDWDSRLSLWTVRTGSGTDATGSMLGGTTLMQLSNAPQTFLRGGSGNTLTRSNIPIQYEIRGLSVLIPVKTYTTTVVFTITN